MPFTTSGQETRVGPILMTLQHARSMFQKLDLCCVFKTLLTNQAR